MLQTARILLSGVDSHHEDTKDHEEEKEKQEVTEATEKYREARPLLCSLGFLLLKKRTEAHESGESRIRLRLISPHPNPLPEGEGTERKLSFVVFACFVVPLPVFLSVFIGVHLYY